MFPIKAVNSFQCALLFVCVGGCKTLCENFDECCGGNMIISCHHEKQQIICYRCVCPCLFVYRLAKYLVKLWITFDDNFRNQIPDVHPQLINFWSTPDSQCTQLFNLCQYNYCDILVVLTNIKLIFGVVLGEIQPCHIIRALKDLARPLFKAFASSVGIDSVCLLAKWPIAQITYFVKTSRKY